MTLLDTIFEFGVESPLLFLTGACFALAAVIAAVVKVIEFFINP